MLASLSARRAWIEIGVLLGCIKEVLSLSARRAWIEILESKQIDPSVMSLSARRAWIEMLVYLALIRYLVVALRKESVDRNLSALPGKAVTTRSLSARRAWIEMLSNDQNAGTSYCRSPQGERG